MQKSERDVIWPVTLAGFVEFYDIYLYAYWAEILVSNFSRSVLSLTESIISGLLFILIIISRSAGGLFFGYIGDRFGRKLALLSSIITISATSIAAAVFSPAWGMNILLFIGIIKILQGFSLGGELPAAICLMAEISSSIKRRWYLCSYVLIGPQIAQIISMAQSILSEKYFTHDFLVQTGWRISLGIAALLGLISFFLRNRLHESLSYKKIKKDSEVSKNPIKEVLKNNKLRVMFAFLISVFEVTSFYMIAFFFEEHFSTIFNISKEKHNILNILFLIPIIFIQPLFGKIAEKFGPKPLLKTSGIVALLILLPFYFSILHSSTKLSLIIFSILIINSCIQFALLPSILSSIFPESIRFTGIGLGYNICNSMIGHMAPNFGNWLTVLTRNQASFLVIYLLSAIIFLGTLKYITKKNRIFSY